MRARLRRPGSHVPATLALVASATLHACESAPFTGDAHHVDSFPQLALVETLRIGSVDDPESGFSSISAVDIDDDDGNVYVLERREREVRVYARDGTRLRAIGRRGSGPGEFDSPTALGVIGDTVWVNDGRLRRITLFTRTGELLATVDANDVPVTTEGETTVNARPARLRPGGLIEVTLTFARVGPGPAVPIVAPRVLLDLTGAIADTVAFDTLTPPVRPDEADLIRVGGVVFSASRGPSDEPLTLATPDDGKVVVERPIASSGDDSEFRVTRLAKGGDTIFHRVFRYTPVANTDEVKDSIASRGANEMARIVDAPLDVEELREALRGAGEQPPYLVPVTQIRIGADESIWIQREYVGLDYTWIVLAPDGTPRGRVTIPHRDIVRRYTAAELWVASPDEYDVQWLVRYVLSEREPGSSEGARSPDG